ncbi:phenylalanine--tRNA ligase subunit beta [Candidatus Peregrinibacteria bacterium RIFCSPLOWO2_01_FULL_48_20]|nr:MAG: phenylalanine--tRNA ligase subunit beta [Candidatus Peregrinibacteria bacterium RIFCSPLOWO2_01_FULL_48_20]
MNISLNWLREFLDLPHVDGKTLGMRLTSHTAEVEAVIDEARLYEKMVLGKVTALRKHPGADRLNIAQVDIGEKTVQIVCGGQNLFEGMLVAVALPGSHVRWHGEGDLAELSEAKIRGETSYGMICAGEEIGLPADNGPDSTEVHIHDLSVLKAKAGTPLAEALGRNDIILEIDNKSLTHRPDLWGHYGMAREVAAIFGKPLKKIAPKNFSVGKEKISIKLENATLCPRFSAAILTGIKIEESPDWMKTRLSAAGMNPHNNIVDITNYVMLELGQPMHAYDRKVVGDDGFIVRYAKKGEKLITLDETEQKLSEEDPLVCSASGEPLGLAGIKGGLKSGINEATTEIILEAANFNAIVVRKSSMRHMLRTDASQRFEKSLDASMTDVALKRAVELILELCPKAKLSTVTTVGTWKPPKLTLTVSPENICRKIGVKISAKEISAILKSLEFGVTASGKNLKIAVPSHRATGDVDIEEDIVEEVARIYGYEKIPAIRPDQPMKLPMENEERFYKHLTRNIFALGLGFTEVTNYSFVNKDRFERCGIPEEGHLKILNYLSEDQTHLRTTLVPNLLNNAADNHRECPSIRIFELGRTYKEIGEFMPLEEKRLAVLVAEPSESFYAAKGALETFLKTFRAGTYQLKTSQKPLPYAHPKKSLDILLTEGELQKNQCIGQLFTVHPAVLKAFDIPLSVSMFELNFSELVKQGRETVKFSPLPKFPSMFFDVSVLVDKKVTVGEAEKCIQSANLGNLLKSIVLFDIYEGQGIPKDKKSLSFSIEIRHDDRTLTDKELQTVQEGIFLALEQFGGKIRGL